MGEVANADTVVWTRIALKNIWDDLFDPDYYNTLNIKDPAIQGVLMVLETAIAKVKQIGTYSESVMKNYKSSLQELELKTKECVQLQEAIRLREHCGKCTDLKKELFEANRKAKEAQTRMNSIASILKLGNGENASSGASADLVTQMIMHTTSPVRKKRAKMLEKIKSDKEEAILVASTIDLLENLHSPVNADNCNIVPETAAEHSSNFNFTPKKAKEECNIVLASPVQESYKEKKKFSSSVNLPPSHLKEGVNTKKNLSDNFFCSNSPVKTPKKDLIFSLEMLSSNLSKDQAVKKDNDKGDKSGEEKLSESLLERAKHNQSELDKMRFNDHKGFTEHEAEKSKSPQKFWKLKELRSSNKPTCSKRLKQMKLSVSVKEKKTDISKMKEFKGGELKEGEEIFVSEDEEEIVSPSPKGKKRGKRKLSKGGFAVFAPVATSTQIPSLEGDNSFDRLPSRENKSPNYRYKREPVRKKEERAKLKGTDCEDCAKYYKALGEELSPSKLRSRMNLCSRHRDKEENINMRMNTPPGFWDPCIPDTPECKERGMYTSVYYTRNK